jgi:hypothetical protein
MAILANLLFPLIARKFLSSYTTGGLSRRDQLHRVSYLIVLALLLQLKHTGECK